MKKKKIYDQDVLLVLKKIGKLRFIWSYSIFLIFYNLESGADFRKLSYIDSYREGFL
jgi:hypothetical protein